MAGNDLASAPGPHSTNQQTVFPSIFPFPPWISDPTRHIGRAHSARRFLLLVWAHNILLNLGSSAKRIQPYGSSFLSKEKCPLSNEGENLAFNLKQKIVESFPPNEHCVTLCKSCLTYDLPASHRQVNMINHKSFDVCEAKIRFLGLLSS